VSPQPQSKLSAVRRRPRALAVDPQFDFEPERSVLLHAGGVPVTIPRAERYAVHKLIVAVDRVNQAKW